MRIEISHKGKERIFIESMQKIVLGKVQKSSGIE